MVTIMQLSTVIRQRVNDNDKINYTDEEIVADVAMACRYLSNILINRRSPEMIVSEDIVDYSAVPEDFHSFVGQFPAWREGPVFRTSTGQDAVTIKYWGVRGNKLSSLNDTMPFNDSYQDIVVTIASMLLLNRDEFDTGTEQTIISTIQSLLPPLVFPISSDSKGSKKK